MRYKIEVKRKDINNGRCNSTRKCAVALAMRRRFGKMKGYDGVEVEEYSARVWLGGLPTYVDFPKKTTNFIYRFDDEGNRIGARAKMQPFSFAVNV